MVEDVFTADEERQIAGAGHLLTTYKEKTVAAKRAFEDIMAEMETVYVQYRMQGVNSAAAKAWTALQRRKNRLIDGPTVTGGGLDGEMPSILDNVETFVEDNDALITKARTSPSPRRATAIPKGFQKMMTRTGRQP